MEKNEAKVEKNRKTQMFFKMIVTKDGTILDKFERLSEARLLSIILRRMDITTLQWVYNKEEYKIISEELEKTDRYLSEPTVKGILTGFVKLGILIRVVRGLYRVNNEYIDFGSDTYVSTYSNVRPRRISDDLNSNNLPC